MPERVAVVGSRGFAARWKVEEFIDELPSGTVVVSGGARGVDTWAVDRARERGLGTEVFPAEWERYGGRAGFLRNRLVVGEADRVVAFWDGVSKGTKHTIDLAERSGVDLSVVFA